MEVPTSVDEAVQKGVSLIVLAVCIVIAVKILLSSGI